LFPSKALPILPCLLFPNAEASARTWRCTGRVVSPGGSRLAQPSCRPSRYSSFSDVLVGRQRSIQLRALTTHRVSALSDSKTFVSLPRINMAANVTPLEDHCCQHQTGEYLRAYESLALLRNTRLQAARDLMLISAQVRVEDDLFQASGVTGKSSKRLDKAEG
jgi:hypothetical protein